MFRIGQKVVCVDASITPGYRWLGDISKEGDTYTVVGLAYARCETHLTLAELENISCVGNVYRARRFRPVATRKTDISIFQAMLTPSPVTVDAMNVADHAREIVG